MVGLAGLGFQREGFKGPEMDGVPDDEAELTAPLLSEKILPMIASVGSLSLVTKLQVPQLLLCSSPACRNSHFWGERDEFGEKVLKDKGIMRDWKPCQDGGFHPDVIQHRTSFGSLGCTLVLRGTPKDKSARTHQRPLPRTLFLFLSFKVLHE